MRACACGFPWVRSPLASGWTAAERAGNRVLGSPGIRVLWTDPATFRKGWNLMRSRHDKRWSLTDCISFVTMEEFGIEVALTLDADFRQAGFQVIPEI